MEFQIKIICGDWSNDGHGMTESTTIESNIPMEQIEVAYKRGAKEIGLDFRQDVAREFEDNKMSQEQVDLLRSHNIHTEIDEYFGKPGYYSLSPETYIEVFLEICKVGNYNFNFEIIESKDVHVGGYGLFYS